MGSKKAAKLVLSVSVFSAVVALSFPFLVNSLYDMYLSAFRSALEKNFAFLLCNGLLVIIFRNSGLAEAKPSQTLGLYNDTPVHKTTPVVASEHHVVMQERREETELAIVQISEQEEEKTEPAVVQISEQEEEKTELAVVQISEQEEEEGAIDELPNSTDEFNKKCEEFIRRIKEEIKLGGR